MFKWRKGINHEQSVNDKHGMGTNPCRMGANPQMHGPSKMLAHESIWSGTFDRSTSLQKLQSNALERTFLSSHNS